MNRKIVGCIIFYASISLTCAQQPFVIKDSDNRKANVYASVQINQLLRQILSFGGNPGAVNNPYLFNLGINSAQTGWGVNLSHGFNLSEFGDGDAIIDRKSKINDQFFRIGFEKKSMISTNWMVSWGLDIIAESQKSETSTTSKQSGNNFFSSEISAKVGAQGFGPRIAINYKLSEKILVGTECNYYYKKGKNESENRNVFTSQEFDPITGEVRFVRTSQNDESTQKFKRFQFNAPAVIYLILKF